MNVKKKPQGLVQVAKIEGLVSCDLGHRFEPCACKLSMVFKWRRVEGRACYPLVSKAAVGLKGWP